MEIRQIIMIQRMRLDGVSRASTVIAFIVLLIVVPAAWVYAEGKYSSGSTRPNIILILVDDLGWADPGFHGGDVRLTPNIDRFARQGMQLSQFCMTPVCATSRSALLTGRYPFRQWMDWRSEDFGKPDYLALLDIHWPRFQMVRLHDGFTGSTHVNELSLML